MTGARIHLDVIGIDVVQSRLGRLADAGRDLRPVFDDVGEHLVRTTKDRFREQKDPEGNPWAPLSEDYQRRKKRNRDKILTRDGFLGGTINFRASSLELLVGSPLIYAGTHQHGAKKGSFGATSRGSPIPWGDIPAREFLGLSDEDREAILDIVTDHLASAVD